ncbi:Glycine dehydrogenase (aminomethyl-transferring) [Trypanosoma cruzi]|nr:Glycine dehydrogenase (aminomethyl-transferring) [Trypanosoma cruzi]
MHNCTSSFCPHSFHRCGQLKAKTFRCVNGSKGMQQFSGCNGLSQSSDVTHFAVCGAFLRTLFVVLSSPSSMDAISVRMEIIASANDPTPALTLTLWVQS